MNFVEKFRSFNIKYSQSAVVSIDQLHNRLCQRRPVKLEPTIKLQNDHQFEIYLWQLNNQNYGSGFSMDDVIVVLKYNHSENKHFDQQKNIFGYNDLLLNSKNNTIFNINLNVNLNKS